MDTPSLITDHRRPTPAKTHTLSAISQLRGVVHDRRKEPIEGATVCVTVIAENCCRPDLCVATDRRGEFVLAVTENPGTGLIASARGYRTKRRDGIAMEPGEAAGEILIELQQGGNLLRGSVEDVYGGAVAGAAVAALETSSSEKPLAVTVSESDGSFVLGAPRGTLRLCARADGYSQVCLPVDAPSDANRIVVLPESTIVGEVVRAGTGEPVPDALVRAWNRDGLRVPPSSVRTGPDGRFELRGLPAGGYVVVAAASDARSREAWISLAAGQTSESITLAASPAVTFDGSVIVGRRPCREGHVQLIGPTPSRERLGGDGAVHFDGLLPGPYRATATCGDGGPKTLQFEASSDPVRLAWQYDEDVDDSPEPSSEEKEETPQPGGAIRVSVTESDITRPGGPLQVLARSRDPVPLRARRLGAEYVLDALPNGQYSIYEANHVDLALTVDITAPGQVARVNLALPSSATIAGRVVDAAGQAVADAWVTHQGSNSAQLSPDVPQLTDAEGAFVLQARPDEPYTIRVTSPSGDGQLLGARSGEPAIVHVALPASLSGSVRTSDDEPVEEFTIALHRAGETVASGTHGFSSEFFLPSLPAGEYQLIVRAAHGSGSTGLVLEPGQNAVTSIRLTSDGPTGLAVPQAHHP